MFFFFFFSSRRRHTRWNCDWSSDVCSSDLLVVSNPPYVGADEIEQLEPELTWEPRAALLDEGQTARLADEARAVLDGWLVLEVHADRARDVAEQLSTNGYRRVSISLDLAGRERVVEARWARTALSNGP